MSEKARAALINIGTNRQGTPIPASTPQAAIDELSRLGFIGQNNGLTRSGSVKRELIYAALLDEAF